MKKKISLFTALGMFLFQSVLANEFPLSIAIFPPVQFPPTDYTVTGLRLSILWGKHQNLYGLDLGVIGNITEGDFGGTSLGGFFNKTNSGTAYGTQITFGLNINTAGMDIKGIQLAGLANLDLGKLNVYGLQLGMVNLASKIVGVGIGLVNKTEEVYGFQLGLVNVAKSLRGLQIGLVNIHRDGYLPFFPIMNVGF